MDLSGVRAAQPVDVNSRIDLYLLYRYRDAQPTNGNGIGQYIAARTFFVVGIVDGHAPVAGAVPASDLAAAAHQAAAPARLAQDIPVVLIDVIGDGMVGGTGNLHLITGLAVDRVDPGLFELETFLAVVRQGSGRIYFYPQCLQVFRRQGLELTARTGTCRPPLAGRSDDDDMAFAKTKLLAKEPVIDPPAPGIDFQSTGENSLSFEIKGVEPLQLLLPAKGFDMMGNDLFSGLRGLRRAAAGDNRLGTPHGRLADRLLATPGQRSGWLNRGSVRRRSSPSIRGLRAHGKGEG